MEDADGSKSLEDGKSTVSYSLPRLPDSDSYLEKLETKLSNLQGKQKALRPKDMLELLRAAREDQMEHLNASSRESTFLPECEIQDKELSQTFLEKKLFPHKSPLTYEELQHLLEADVLAKISAEVNQEATEAHR